MAEEAVSSSSAPDDTQIAVGQFDLAATNEVKRGDRYLQIKDLHPPPEKGSAESNIINKYN